jgi:TPR repeat protein
VVQDVPNLRAHVESRAQRPLWWFLAVIAAATICLVVALVGPAPAQTAPATGMDAQIAEARNLFLANRLTEALDALDDRTLAQSGKANLLAGLIHLLGPDIDHDAAKMHLERAGNLGVGHAYSILGNIIFDEGCSTCIATAEGWYSRALGLGDNIPALFGRAVARLDDRREDAIRDFEVVFARAPKSFYGVFAATFLGGLLIKENPQRAEELLLHAAAQGMPEAQEALGLLLLQQRRSEAEKWLALAVAQRMDLARRWYSRQSTDRHLELLHQSSIELVIMARQEKTMFGAAARWCRTPRGTFELVCLAHAIEGYRECGLSEESAALLSIRDFESSAVYGACRARMLPGPPL